MNKIYIVQHCQSEHHVNELTGGWTDTPLTTLGKRQAEEVVKELNKLEVKDFKLYSSDLKRAFMTAEVISSNYSTEITSHESLREINNGEAANKTKEWAQENMLFKSDYLELDKQIWKNCETPRELHDRMSTFIREHILNEDGDVVIVSHGVAIGYLISSWLGMSAEMMKDGFLKGNAGGISCLTKSPMGQNILTFFNSTSHLRGL